MKVLLIGPTTEGERKNPYAIVKRVTEPLGLCYCSAIAQEYGHSAIVCHQLNSSEEDILKLARGYSPDVIGFSALSYNFKSAKNLASRLKSEFPDAIMVFGGYHASLNPSIVKEESIDFVVRGEGEKTFADLLCCIEKNGDFNEVIGIAFYDKSTDKVVITPPRHRIEDLDKLPFPDRKDLPMEKYASFAIGEHEYPNTRFATIYSSRGCTFGCKFCCTPDVYGKLWTHQSPKRTVDEIEFLVKNYGINQVDFRDENFSINKRYVDELCNELKQRKKRKKFELSWTSFGNISCVNKEMLTLMKESGYSLIFYGVESPHQNVLNELGRKYTLRDIKQIFEMTREAGIYTRASFMIGYPWETAQTIQDYASFLREIKPDSVYLPAYTPFPGTKAYEDAKRKNLLLTEDTDKFDCENPVIRMEGLSPEQLIEARWRILMEYYSSDEWRSMARENIAKRKNAKQTYERFLNSLKEYNGITVEL